MEAEDDLEFDVKIYPWINLHKFYWGSTTYPLEGDHRAFRAWTGVHPLVAEKIWQKYGNCEELPDRSWLLIVLHFLKDMPSEDIGALLFKLSRKTYRLHLWTALNFLDKVMDEVYCTWTFLTMLDSFGR